ncbi:hypothetical protein [Jeotgalibacillus campisalis]|uniref:Uncharacterized protein n=1 Tax=Jeotgalibacillus campisalis TaxID=220754 RepID=A0A0C2VGX2_9BACL|nr:hypothetical protein [Jeotgalibacillus campisalis]KIL43766.1 hypothetical protein KR50_32860 [Jeotgalibacillus campisalis]
MNKKFMSSINSESGDSDTSGDSSSVQEPDYCIQFIYAFKAVNCLC